MTLSNDSMQNLIFCRYLPLNVFLFHLICQFYVVNTFTEFCNWMQVKQFHQHFRVTDLILVSRYSSITALTDSYDAQYTLRGIWKNIHWLCRWNTIMNAVRSEWLVQHSPEDTQCIGKELATSQSSKHAVQWQQLAIPLFSRHAVHWQRTSYSSLLVTAVQQTSVHWQRAGHSKPRKV